MAQADDATTPANSAEYGKRLLPTVIDELATEDPARVYASIPWDDDDLSNGFRDITYQQLANSINRAAHWLDLTLGKASQRQAGESWPTFAYMGPKDLRYPIFLVAAAKVGRRMLVPSTLAAPEAHVHLANQSDCKTFFHPGMRQVAEIKKAIPDSVDVIVPGLQELLFDETQVPVYPYAKTFEDAAHDEVCIYHTSGSSGFPKIVVYNNKMICTVDKMRLLAERSQRPMFCWATEDRSRFFSGIPLFHAAGMYLGLWTAVYDGPIPVLGPANKTNTADIADQIHRFGIVESGMYPPALVEDLVRNPDYLSRLTKFKFITAGGAPLSKDAGDKLYPFGGLHLGIGSTEGAMWPVYKLEDRKDWQYFEFHEALCARFDHHTDDYYEMVIQRKPLSEEYTTFFEAMPDLKEEFRTKDLWSPHPTKRGLWKYEGRTDDLVVLIGEVKMYAGHLEEKLRNIKGIKHALVGGQQRHAPFVLIEPFDPPVSAADQKRLLDQLWPMIAEENRNVLKETQLQKRLALIVPKNKPFIRLAKGSVDRRSTFKLLAGEIDALYGAAQM